MNAFNVMRSKWKKQEEQPLSPKQKMWKHRRAVDMRKRRHIYKHNWETRGHRVNFVEVQVVATENSELSTNFLKECIIK